MSKIASVARRFVRDEQGATMVEYGIMLAAIAVICIGAVVSIGGNANTTFGNAATAASGVAS